MSDRVYAPDKWVIIEITNKNGQAHRRVLGSWYGGFTSGDSWRTSSAITEVIDTDNVYRILNESGSVYICAKGCEGMSVYTMNVLVNMQEQADNDGCNIKVVDLS